MSGDDSALEVNRPSSESEDFAGIRCPECGGRMVVHQPDERLPHRLLGTCRCCLAWFLMDDAGGLVFRLPDEIAPRDASVDACHDRAARAPAVAGNPHRLDGPEDMPKRRRRGRGASAYVERSPPRD